MNMFFFFFFKGGMENGKEYIPLDIKKMTALMFSSVSMTVSLVRVCVGGNLGTASFNNPHT